MTNEFVDENHKINYDKIIEKYPWIIEKNRKCILSPDCDGLLCGLLMSHILNWEVVGFYDCKILILKENEKIEDCVFLDVEIFRKEIKSLGHHMVLYNKRITSENWINFSNSIQPNNIRGYDGKQNFKFKYPLGAIHLLIGIIGHKKQIDIKESAICPLLYTDGTFKNLFNYPENCLSWLNFLYAEEENSPLKKIFFNDHYTTSSLMIALKNFFDEISSIGEKRGDKIKISNKNGEPVNLELNDNTFMISNIQKNNIIKFLKILSNLTGWFFDEKNWTFEKFKIYKFTKKTIKPNNKNFIEMIKQNPISWAMTSTILIEYTIEKPDKLL